MIGQPISDRELAQIRQYDREGRQHGQTDYAVQRRQLLLHIAFLERLLADADDLARTRRAGYEDGWRAGMLTAASEAEVAAAELADRGQIEGAAVAEGLAAKLMEMANEGR
jgi:hypothetical protein